MIYIGVCEDDENQAKQIKDMAEKCLFGRTEYQITHYQSGEYVVNAIEKNEFKEDLLLLDIHMMSLDGLKTAEYIRNMQVDVDIIFITVSEKYVYEGYIYKAFSYIRKPIDHARFENELIRYMDERERVSKCLEITINGVIQRLPLEKVFFFESNARKITVYTNGENIEFYNKLDMLEGMLSERGFIRCHQSYLINEKYIDSMSRESVMVKGEKIPMSRKYYERMKAEGRFF